MLEECSFIKTDDRFYTPDFFERKKLILQNLDEDNDEPWMGPTLSYYYEDVVLNYFYNIPPWAAFDDDYPQKGLYLGENEFVKEITYNSGKNVFSGYTTMGNIFYLKKNYHTVAEDFLWIHVLVLIYPKEKQSDVKKLIDIVRKSD